MMVFKVKSKTLQDVLKVLYGNIVSQGLGFLTIILISRDLGAEQYGIFSLLLAIFTISVQVSDFGVSTSYIKYLSENVSQSREIFFTVIISKIVLSILIIISLYFLSEYISIFFFDSNIYSKLIQFISFAILFHSIVSVIAANYQAKQQFRYFAFMNIFNNLLKLITILMIAFFFVENKHLVYYVYIYSFSPLSILLFFMIKRYKEFTLQNRFQFYHFIQIYKLGFWIFLSSLATMIMMRLDIMMLQKMSTSQEVGYYSVAMNLAMIFPLITSSLTTTLLPKLNDFLKNHSLKEYIAKILVNIKYIILLLIILELLSPYIITVLFGHMYIHSVKVFQVLIVAFTFGIIVNPISIIIYSINRAYVGTVLNWIQLPLNYFGNVLFIPLFGAFGAAMSTVLIYIFAGIFIYVYLIKYIGKNINE